MASSGLQAWVIIFKEKEGGKSDAFTMYAKDNIEDEERVLQILAQNAKAGGIPPGQGTICGEEEEKYTVVKIGRCGVLLLWCCPGRLK